MKYTIEKKSEKNTTFQANVKINIDQINKAKEQAIENLRKNLKLPGFRKGKVPKDVALKKLTESDILQETAKIVFSDVFLNIVKNEKLSPFGEPSIEPIEISFSKSWRFIIKIPLKPKITLPDYKTVVKNIKSEFKKNEIWAPGKDKKEVNEKVKKDMLLNKILEELLEKTKLEISELIIEKEVKKRLASLIDDVRKAGLTFDEYLKAKNTDVESIKKRFREEIEGIYKMELMLEEIANKENIEVKQEEIEKLLNIKPEDKEKFAQTQYYYAMLLRKQKTLEFLLDL